VGDNGLSSGGQGGEAGIDGTAGDDGPGPSSDGTGITPTDATMMSSMDTGASDHAAPADGEAEASDGSHQEGTESGVDSGGDSGMDATLGADATPDAPVESGGPDSSGVDGGDASTAEAGPEAGPDAGPEAGPDAAPDTGGGLGPCTTAGQTGCVQCDGNSGGLCTPTEAAFIAYDVKKGNVTAPGATSATSPNSCYECLLQAGCLDDTAFMDHGKECEVGPFDLAADALTTGTAAECETVVSCILGSSCASVDVSACFCGTAGLSSTCQGNPAPGPINGACASDIATGLGFPVSDGTDNTKNLTDTTRAAGRADQIFQCALSNGCPTCL
jgi:hypothetical protein